jgi:hypothetical protein
MDIFPGLISGILAHKEGKGWFLKNDPIVSTKPGLKKFPASIT